MSPAVFENRRFDTMAAAVAGMVIVVCAYMLATDTLLFVPSWTEVAGEAEAVGSLAERTGHVQRKPGRLPAWQETETYERLFARDQIFTDEGGEAVIALDEGGRLELGPRTMISLEQHAGRPKLHILKGRIRITGKAPLEIRVAKGPIIQAGRDTSLALDVTEAGAATMQVISGKASARGREITAGESLEQVVADSGETVIATYSTPLTLQSPGHGVRMTADRPVTFRWDGEAGAFRLQISQDPAFRDVLIERRTSAREVTLESLPPGRLYWKVEVTGASRHPERSEGPGEATEIRRLDLESLSPPTAVWPEQNQILPAASGTKTFATLRWTELNARSYQVQLDRAETFAEPLLDLEVSDRRLETPGLQNGRYFWRVRNARENGAWSRAFPFTIGEANAPILAPPALPGSFEIFREPVDGGEGGEGGDDGASLPFWLFWLEEDQAFAGERSRITWPPVSGAREYDVQVSLDRTFSETTEHTRVSVAEADLHDLPPGRYFVRIATVNRDGIVGPYSPPVPLIVHGDIKPDRSIGKSGEPRPLGSVQEIAAEIPPPVADFPPPDAHFELATLVPTVGFRWKEAERAGSYQLQVAKDQDFAEIVHERRTRGQDATVALPEGEYHWRLRSLDHGRPAGPWGSPRTLAVKRLEPILPPADLETAGNLSLDAQRRKTTVSLSWSSEGRSPDTYRLVLGAGKEPVLEKLLEDTQTNVTLDRGGRYWWYVEAIDRKRQVARRSPVERFAIGITKSPDPSEIQNGPIGDDWLVVGASYMPSKYSYQSQGDAAGTDIDATLFNAVALGGEWRVAKRLALTGRFQRTATTLFDEEDQDFAAGQEPVDVEPVVTALGTRWDALGPGWWRISLVGGYMHQTILRFTRKDDQTMAVHHHPVDGLELGGEGEVFLGRHWTLNGGSRIFRSLATKALTPERHLQGELALKYTPAPGPYSLGLGFRQELGRYKTGDGEIRIEQRMTSVVASLWYGFRR